MPELPEVETIRRGLRRHAVGARLADLEVRERRLRRPVDVGSLRDLVGRRIEEVDRRGKYLIVHLEGGETLLIHLGMSGRLLLMPTGAPVDDHDHLRWRLDGMALPGADEMRFRDPRRFGSVLRCRRSGLDDHPALAGLGIEPLEAAFTGATLEERAAGSRRPIKTFLMDGRIVAGMGNIYVNESLWEARINPRTTVDRIAGERWRRLGEAVRKVLRSAIEAGGTTLEDYRDLDGDVGTFQVHLQVYDRAGEACRRCGDPVRRIVQAGRSTFYCTGCQH